MPFSSVVRLLYGFTLGFTGTALIREYISTKYSGCKVLMYHSIQNRARFQRHISYLSRRYRLVRAAELLEQLESGKPPNDDWVCLTFDDGHATFFQNAYPALREVGAPAIIFVPTGPVDHDTLLWFDKIEVLLSRSSAARLHPLLTERFGYPISAIDLVYKMKNWPMDEIEYFIHKVAQHVPDTGATDNTKKLMTWEQIKAIHREGLVEIGSHTVNHAILANLDKATVRRELVESRQKLEEQLQCRVVHLAYPNGLEMDYSRETITEVQAAGYRSAFTTLDGSCTLATDRWQIPRIAVEDTYTSTELHVKLRCPWPDRVQRYERLVRTAPR